MPSPHLVAFLVVVATLQEVRRAGEHTATADALQLLLWELHGSLLSTLQQLLYANSATSNGNTTAASAAGATSNGSHKKNVLSEKGVLQLLFDQRFMRDVLAGGKPLVAVAAAADKPGVPGAGSVGGVHMPSSNGNVHSGASAETAARKQLVSGVEQQLQVSDSGPTSKRLWWQRQQFM